MRELFEESVKNLIQERAKFIEDYVKFWLAVNTDLTGLTAEVFANNYSLTIIQEQDKTTYTMVDIRKDIIIEKSEIERLKKLDENVKRHIESLKEWLEISNYEDDSEKECLESELRALEGLYE